MITLDACAVIYLMKKNQPDLDGERGRKVDAYSADALAANLNVAVPTVAVSEVLAMPGMNPDEVFELLANYELLDFDTAAATVSGKIASTTNWKSAVLPFPGGRQLVKLDTLIAATAISVYANVLLTNDDRYEKLLANYPIHVVMIDQLPQP